jgi:hypothetical protein
VADYCYERGFLQVCAAVFVVVCCVLVHHIHRECQVCCGVEVVEIDILTSDNVADYCYERGFLQVCTAVFACCLQLCASGASARSGRAWSRFVCHSLCAVRGCGV